MARSVFLTTSLVLLLLTAGCLGSTDDLATDGDEGTVTMIVPGQAVTPIDGDPLPADGPGHDHSEAEQHGVEINMELVARPEIPSSSDVHYWSNSIPIGLNIRFGEMDSRGDLLGQCSRDAEGAYLWDITDRAAPVLAGRLVNQGACPDIKLTEDAAFAIIGGNKVYDLADPYDPVLVLDSDANDINSCHMCSMTTIDEQEYIVLTGASGGGAGFRVVRFDRDPVALEEVGSWAKDLAQDSLQTLAEQDIASGVHDQYVYHDEILNRTLVVPAMWDYGIYVVDISDPTNPTDLGHWGAYRGESGNIHTTAVDFREVDGELRRIIVGATETGTIIGGLSATEPGYVYIFDATDLSNIQLLGKWANPGLRSTGYDTTFFPVGEYSAHNVQFLDGKVYMAHYHAGVWVIDVDAYLATNAAPKGDLRTPLPDDIPNLGVFLTRDSEIGGPGAVWDVVVDHGYIYASDYSQGLYVLHFLGDPLNDPAITSTA